MKNICDKQLKVEIQDKIKQEILEPYEYNDKSIDNTVKTRSLYLPGQCNELDVYLLAMSHLLDSEVHAA